MVQYFTILFISTLIVSGCKSRLDADVNDRKKSSNKVTEEKKFPTTKKTTSKKKTSDKTVTQSNDNLPPPVDIPDEPVWNAGFYLTLSGGGLNDDAQPTIVTNDLTVGSKLQVYENTGCNGLINEFDVVRPDDSYEIALDPNKIYRLSFKIVDPHHDNESQCGRKEMEYAYEPKVIEATTIYNTTRGVLTQKSGGFFKFTNESYVIRIEPSDLGIADESEIVKVYTSDMGFLIELTENRASSYYFPIYASGEEFEGGVAPPIIVKKHNGVKDIRQLGRRILVRYLDGGAADLSELDYSPVDLSGDFVKFYGVRDRFVGERPDGSLFYWEVLEVELEEEGPPPENMGPYIEDKTSGLTFTNGFTQLIENNGSFAGIRADNTVVGWGEYNASISASVQSVFATEAAFAALKSDGSIEAWGSASLGGDISGKPLGSGVVSVVPGRYAFAAIKGDDSVVAWGNSKTGGDSSGVSFAGGVSGVCAGDGYFVALKNDNTVVSWGNIDVSPGNFAGGVASIHCQKDDRLGYAVRADGSIVAWWIPVGILVSSQIVPEFGYLSEGYTKLVSNGNALAALYPNGTVDVVGSVFSGGDFSLVGEVNNVSDVVAAHESFIATKNDGSLVSWGKLQSEGINVGSGVKQYVSNNLASAVLMNDGRVLTWGGLETGGDSSGVNFSKDVKDLFATANGFIARFTDDSAVGWGLFGSYNDLSGFDLSAGLDRVEAYGGISILFLKDGTIRLTNYESNGLPSGGLDQTSGIKKILAYNAGEEPAYVAEKNDGSILVWGHNWGGGDATGVDFSSGLKELYAMGYGFVGLKNNGDVVSWASPGCSLDSASVDFSSGVKELHYSHCAVTALKNNGDLVAWGSANHGGDLTGVDLSGQIIKVLSADFGFAAMKADGSIIAWGSTDISDLSGLDFKDGASALYKGAEGFTAVLKDGTAVTWGGWDGNYTHSKTVSKVFETSSGAVLEFVDGSVFVEFVDTSGLDFSSGIKEINLSNSGSIAVKNDGKIVLWGGMGKGSSSAGLPEDIQSSLQGLSVDAVWPGSGSYTIRASSGEYFYWGTDAERFGDMKSLIPPTGIDIEVISDTFYTITQEGKLLVWGDAPPIFGNSL